MIKQIKISLREPALDEIAAIDHAKSKDVSIIQLTTNIKRPRAKEFYERLGFEVTHVGMKYYLRVIFDLHPAYCMSKNFLIKKQQLALLHSKKVRGGL